MKELLQNNGFSQDEISTFMSDAKVIKCPKKTVLLNEGEVCQSLYFVTKGVFRAGFIDAEATEYTRAFFSVDTQPFAISYRSFINQCPSLSFVDTLEEG